MLRLIYFIIIFCSLDSGVCLAVEPLSDEIKLLITKAEAGDAEAQFSVASAYDSGLGVLRNGKKQ